ncbi:MAG: universal stress protein [Thermoplasmatota archaeon]
MYDQVILPTDGSKNAMRGVEEGLQMARSLGIKAVGIYVVDVSEYKGLHHTSIKESARSGMKSAGHEALDEIEEMADEMGVELERKILEGKPFEQIAAAAKDTDIIYISSHGFSGFTKLFMGSTTERVIKNAEATVAVVKGKYTVTEERDIEKEIEEKQIDN